MCGNMIWLTTKPQDMQIESLWIDEHASVEPIANEEDIIRNKFEMETNTEHLSYLSQEHMVWLIFDWHEHD